MTRPINTTSRKTRGPKLQTAIDTLLKWPRSQTELLKKTIFEDFNITAKGYQDYYNRIKDIETSESKELYDILNQIYIAELSGSGTPFERYSKELYKWNKKYGSKIHPHHKEYSNIASQLRVIYEALLDIKEDLDVGNNVEMGQKDGKNRAIPDPYKTQIPGAGEEYLLKPVANDTKTNKDVSALFNYRDRLKVLPKVIEQYRSLYIAALAISRKTDFTGNVDDIQYITQDFITKLDQAKWDVVKKKHVQVFDNQAKMEVSLVSEDMNKLLASIAEGPFGKYSQDLMETGNIPSGKLSKALKNVDFGKLEGSKSLKNEVAQQLTNALTKGTKGSYKKTTRKTAKSSTAKAKRTNKINKINTRPLAAPNPRGKSKKEQGSGESIESLVRLKALINKRLPAEVRRNMGRPALINRTSRFSNSVELTRLTESPAGISGDYTYRLSPYETFENTGSKKWPSGYNPKPLIAKSIRNLAVQYTKQRFSYLRRN